MPEPTDTNPVERPGPAMQETSPEERAEADAAETELARSLLADALGGMASDEAEAPSEDAPSETADEAQDAPEEDHGDQEPAAATPAQDVVQALKRAGYSDEAIGKMDGELAEMLAEKAKADKAAQDRDYQEFLEQKRTAKAETDERPQEAGDEPHPSVAPTLKEFSQPLADDLGIEPDGLAEWGSKLTAPTQQALRGLQGVLEGVLTSVARMQLEGDIPQLKDADSYTRVRERAERLFQDPESDYSKHDPLTGIMAAMRDVAAQEFKDDNKAVAEEARDKSRKGSRRAAASQPTVTTRKPSKPVSIDEWETNMARDALRQAGM